MGPCTSSPWHGIVEPEPHVMKLLRKTVDCGQQFILLPFGSLLPLITSSERHTLPVNGFLHIAASLRIIPQANFPDTTFPWLPVWIGCLTLSTTWTTTCERQGVIANIGKQTCLECQRTAIDQNWVQKSLSSPEFPGQPRSLPPMDRSLRPWHRSLWPGTGVSDQKP
jgi:hypothetical protein